MAIPTFRGEPLFGAAPSITPVPSPPRLQVNSYPGVNGRDAQWHGSDGGESVARFLLIAPDELTLSAYKAVWITLAANAAYGELVDTTGTAWPHVVCVHFTPLEEINPGPGGGVSQLCQVNFIHLI